MIKARDLTIEITNKCNLNCNYCYANSNTKKEELTVEEIKKAIDIIKPYRAIAFTGGEPLLRYNDVIELIPHALKYGDRVRIETNGTIPINWDDLLINGEKKDIRFNTSIDGFKKETDAIRGNGTFDKVMKLVKEANEHGYIIFGKAILDEEILLNDFDYLYELGKFCKEIGMHSMRFGNIKDSGRGSHQIYESHKEKLDKMMLNTNLVSNKIGQEYKCQGHQNGEGFISADMCGSCKYNRGDLILGVDGVIRLECQFLNVPLCHYTKYTPQKHDLGLYLMKKYKLGMEYDKKRDYLLSGRSVLQLN